MPATDRPEPGQRLDQLGLAVALHAGDADDLAGADGEVDAVDRDLVALVEHRQARHLEQRLAGVAGRFSTAKRTGAADHHLGEVGARSPSSGSPSPTILPARSTLIRSATSSTSRSLWVMKTSALPASRSDRTMPKNSIDLLRRQHRRRLVEDEDVGRAEQDLDDLDALLQADRHLLDERVGVDLEAVLGR